MLTTSQKGYSIIKAPMQGHSYIVCVRYFGTPTYFQHTTPPQANTWNFNVSILKDYYFTSNLDLVNVVTHNSECSYFSGWFLKAFFIFCTFPPFLSRYLEFKYEGTQKLQFFNYCKMKFLSQTHVLRCQYKSSPPKLNMVIALPIPVIFMQHILWNKDASSLFRI